MNTYLTAANTFRPLGVIVQFDLAALLATKAGNSFGSSLKLNN